MTGNTPRVSIGLPVYDGERFVGAAIEALLAQDFADFELIISDNASSDSTPDVCKAYEAADDRVRYLRNAQNVGAARNFNLLVDEARGTYFKWAPHDDLHAPTYLSRCVEVLDTRPDVVLCHTLSAAIDESGAVLRSWDALPERASPDPATRFRSVISRPDRAFQVIGLMRRDVLVRTGRIRGFSSSDLALLAELALHGRFHEVGDVLAFYREHPQRSTRHYKTDRERGAWFSPELDGAIVFPLWRLGYAYVQGARRAPLAAGERRRVYATLGPWAWRWRDRLARELAWGVRESVRRGLHRRSSPGHAEHGGRADPTALDR